MRKYHTILALCVLFFAQQTLAAMPSAIAANDPDEATSPNCETIAAACQNAGFVRAGTQGKMFWHDCMKPALMGQPVTGVSIAANDVNACRQFKIMHLQQQLKELQAAAPR